MKHIIIEIENSVDDLTRRMKNELLSWNVKLKNSPRMYQQGMKWKEKGNLKSKHMYLCNVYVDICRKNTQY